MSADDIKAKAQSVHQRLLNLRDRTGEDFNVLLVKYAIERFLYRLSVSPHSDRFVLKGAMLFAVWTDTPHRPTRDLHLATLYAVHLPPPARCRSLPAWTMAGNSGDNGR